MGTFEEDKEDFEKVNGVVKVLKTGAVIIGGVIAIGVSILGAMALGGGDDNNES